MIAELVVALLAHGGQLNTKIGYEAEARILLRVAKEYNLSEEQTRFLVVIRRIENGATSNELGVGSETPNHRARRYRNSPTRSLIVQARWAAASIQKNYRGDLRGFARKWCPGDQANWTRNAAQYMTMTFSKDAKELPRIL